MVEEHVEPPIALRLDGVGFGRALRGFRWPRDIRVHDALIEAAIALVERINAELAYVGSDEINLIVFAPLPYSGRVEKLVSISAGLASAVVTSRLGRILYFDSRIIPLDSEHDAHRYLMFRARVVLNNYVNSLLKVAGVNVSRLKGGLAERIRLAEKLGLKPLAEPWAALGSCIERLEALRIVGDTAAHRRRIVVIDGPCQAYSSKDIR